MREQLAHYGGITVMIPAALMIAVWLWYSAPQAFKWWIITVASTYSIVAFSKLLFKGWGVSFQTLDIAVLSGHAMNTCLMVTVALSLIARQFNYAWRWPATLVGLSLTVGFSAYCVAPYIHPLNEALAGALLGAVAAVAFLWRIDVVRVNVSPSLIGGGLVFLSLCALVPKYNAETLLNHVAVTVSGAQQAHQEPAWRTVSRHIKAE
ncbi:hypothetical protein A7317_17265 [Pseudomonas fluorescens]|jgi:hypothetical protein|uniref:Phosphatidic acid phosphatase type 2/haloperoxidase domain-containing protein n=1 Tax=Pseudomonas fluorescens TaxID=294 RepID=A0A1B3DB33_PSEFL|nr:hypothetical protein [Pseudomonas fluorescens]AOE68683.1 hypothetical protein A7317_17265 [Pseudomonas fluorescens]AOE74493.1 hypothetical protein A7319_17240 [Pseudomonas fluorescens]QOU07695.1 hypothetical protein IM720_13510 [Pseudomonas fluorescens]